MDDIIIVSTGTEADHLAYNHKCLKKLEDDNLRINLQKCHFAKSEIEWLGYKFTQTGISPLESKTAAILTIPPPTTLKRLRSFLGSVHYIGKFIPHLAQLCHPHRPLLKKSVKFTWTDEHTKHFNQIKEKIANSTENSHYNPKLDVRVKCDASRSGLVAALEQNTPDGWKPIAFASRFLNSTEERYSVNELELLGIVWSIDYFKYYLYGKNFTVVTDHRAPLSILKEHRSNKSYNSRLSRWIDRLLPYNFTIEHMPGAKMGLVDYISRNPFARAKNISTYDEHFVVATISKIRDSMKHLIINRQTATKKFKNILKSNFSSLKVTRPSRLTISQSDNSPNCKKAFASQSTVSPLKTPFVPQLTHANSKINPYSVHPFASQMPPKFTKLQSLPNHRKVNNSHSINKFAAKEVQILDSKECEQSEQLSLMQPINDNKSSDTHNNTKLSAKTQIPRYKNHLHKNHSLFAQILPTKHYFVNKHNKPLISNNSVKSIKTMSKAKATRSKSTPTKARVTFSDTTPSTPESNATTHTETRTGSMIDEAEDIMFTETLNKVFSKKFLAILTGKDAILKKVRDCVIRNNAERLQEISPYLFSYWRDLSVKHGCVCLDERIAIPKSIKDAVLEDIHSTHPGSFAMLSLAQNIWWPYIHRDILPKASECKACTEIDEDTIPGRSYLTQEQWADTALWSDTEIERVICAASTRARTEQEKRNDGEDRFIKSDVIHRAIPCSERSVQVKLAGKVHENQRQKKNLDGLCEVLAPGSTVCKISPTTSVIKEPYKQEVRVRNSDIAKFGTRIERVTELAQYIERRPKKINEKTLEQKIQQHKGDLFRKNTGEKKIKRNKKQTDDVSVVSSGRSCISTASNIARSLKMRVPKKPEIRRGIPKSTRSHTDTKFQSNRAASGIVRYSRTIRGTNSLISTKTA